MTLDEARAIGAQKLNVGPTRLEEALNAAKEMQIDPEHIPAVALAMAFMQKAGAFQDPREMQSEFTDALQLVSMAEDEYRMEKSAGSLGRIQ